MIIPVKASGSKPPLIMVHGFYGVFSRAAEIARGLRTDQPFYGLAARGIDGREPPFATAAEMIEAYVRDIRSVVPSGPYRLGAICSGAVIAIDLANALAKAGAIIETVLLVDPQTLQIPIELYQAVDQKPKVLQQLYDNANRYLRSRQAGISFNSRDPRQLHVAASAAVATASLLTMHRPLPYSGRTDLIISCSRAPVYFQPGHPWQNILVGERRLHMLAGAHRTILNEQWPEVMALMRFVLDGVDGVSPFAVDEQEWIDRPPPQFADAPDFDIA